MSASSPWLKFYPQDWRADEKLRLCSLAARGLWIEMLAIMHRSERYGQLLIAGSSPTEAQLAVQVGASTPEVSEMIGQLEAAGVFSRTGSGVIYSRRMTRDHRKANIARKNGKNGGNPSLLKQTGNPASDKPPVKGGVKPQKPEARSQSVPLDKSNGAPPDSDKVFWDAAKAYLNGETKDPGSLIGKWCRDYGKPETAAALTRAQLERPVQKIPFIEGCFRAARKVGTYDPERITV